MAQTTWRSANVSDIGAGTASSRHIPQDPPTALSADPRRIPEQYRSSTGASRGEQWGRSKPYRNPCAFLDPTSGLPRAERCSSEGRITGGACKEERKWKGVAEPLGASFAICAGGFVFQIEIVAALPCTYIARDAHFFSLWRPHAVTSHATFPLAMPDKTILVLGAGPGIGRCVTSLFASKRYNNVVLVARRAENLEVEKKAIEEAVNGRVNVKTYAVDTTKTEDLLTALDDADAAFGKPEVVFYNAARVLPSPFFIHPVEDIEYDLKINVSALYILSQRYIPHLVELAKADSSSQPALIVTSSALPQHPIPQFFALSLVKAAQRNLVQSLSLTYTPEGVHVGVINVAGPVTPEHELRNPTNIAKKTWEWFEGARVKPSFEVEI